MNKTFELYSELVMRINGEYEGLRCLTNDELRSKLSAIEKCITSSENKEDALDRHLVSVYAIVKETARRFSQGDVVVEANAYDRLLARNYDFVVIAGDKAVYKNHWDVCGVPMQWKMVHYDEQLLGGVFLHYGYATEMATGEGKTLVATLPVFLNALTHDGVHLMTVNDYLSRRDFETTRPIYMFHGLTADCIENHPRFEGRRKKAYQSDVVFGTNSTFTFDYLWDHVAVVPEDCAQTTHNYAIVDELDSILIDDADEPHLIGGGRKYNTGDIYKEKFPIVRELLDLKDGEYYESDKLTKSASFTRKGKEWLASRIGIADLYDVERLYEVEDFDSVGVEEQDEIREKLKLQNVFMQILSALTIYEKDEDYIVEDSFVKIVDQNTGRVKESSRWEHGLHTAIEVKENVQVQNDFDGIAVISLKNYFRLYRKIAGMSGTIMPVKDELYEIYDLRCAALPTHKALIREDAPLRVFRTAADKDKAIIDAIVANHRRGRPTLVGNISLKRSDEICDLLEKQDVVFSKLDAKTVKDESILVAKAGLGNAITVSTSVAGRGTDIKPSDDAIANGGLMVIGTDLFDSVRIDRQLKGRAGRQGDPGSSVFFVSLEDHILRNLTAEDREALLEKAGSYDGSEISYDEIRCWFEKAQINREEYFMRRRKSTARKDDIVDPWRRKFYDQRNSVLFNSDLADVIVNDIVSSSEDARHRVEDNLRILYAKAKELIIRSQRNNVNRQKAFVPFSHKTYTFAVHLDIQKAKDSYDYFCNEFKKQIILRIYDSEWKKFVIHMMGNLDKKEIEMLDVMYAKMMTDINSVVLNRLQYSSIPFDVRDSSETENYAGREDRSMPASDVPVIKIEPTDFCPCGSGKKFCECHGSSIRRNNRIKQRR